MSSYHVMKPQPNNRRYEDNQGECLAFRIGKGLIYFFAFFTLILGIPEFIELVWSVTGRL